MDRIFFGFVYGANQKVPFEESDVVDDPVRLHRASEESIEFPASGFRFLPFMDRSSGLLRMKKQIKDIIVPECPYGKGESHVERDQ